MFANIHSIIHFCSTTSA